MPNGPTGRVESVNVSGGGVPKRPVPAAKVSTLGLEGDRQNDARHHGGPDRAVCLFSLEVIRSLQAGGHPIAPGTTGENLTLSGLRWEEVTPGARLRFECGVELEVASFTQPCSTIRDSFRDGAIASINQAVNPGASRVYARVLTEGLVTTGERVYLASPGEASP